MSTLLAHRFLSIIALSFGFVASALSFGASVLLPGVVVANAYSAISDNDRGTNNIGSPTALALDPSDAGIHTAWGIARSPGVIQSVITSALPATTVIANQILRANPILDRNGDGISDVWAVMYPSAGAPTADPDGDGQTNFAEAQAGTDPTNPASRFVATTALDAAGNLIVRWPGVAGKHYFIETSTDLHSWASLSGEYIGTGATLSAIVRPAGAPTGARTFWRVVVFDVDSDGSGLNDWEKTHLDKVAAITATAGANGSISPSGKCYIAKGGSLAFTIIPAAGYAVDQFLVDGQSAGAPGNAYSFANIQASHAISVTFKPGATLIVAPSSLTLPVSNSATLALATGVIWNASSGQLWLAVTPTTGSGNATLTVTANTNIGSTSRSGQITVSGPVGSGLAQVIPITQAAQVPSNVALGKPASASSSESSSYAAAYAVDGNSSTRWASGFSDPQWFVVDLGRPHLISSIELVWEAAYARSYKIQLSMDSLIWGDIYTAASSTGGTEIIPVSGVGRYVRLYCTARGTQYGDSLWEFRVIGIVADAHYLVAAPGTVQLASGAGSASLGVSSDGAWSASSDQPWLTLQPGAGAGNGTITVNATANPAAASRSANVTLSGPAGRGLTQTVAVTQRGSGGSGRGFSRCTINYGQDWYGTSTQYPANLTYIRVWLGSTGSDVGAHVAAMLNACKPGGVLAGRTPMMIGYIIAFTARDDSNLQDCDVAQQQGLSTSLCTNGTQYIRQNKQRLFDKYRSLAAQIAQVWGKTEPIMWMTEPDYYQYSIDEISQIGGGLTYAEAGQYLRDFLAVVKQELPNVVFVMDTAPWLGSHATAWFAAMPMDMMSYVSAYGVPTETIQNGAWSNTWREFHELTGLGVLAEGWAYNAPQANWHDPNTINQLISWGVVAESFRTPPLTWGDVAAANAPLLNSLVTCP